LVMPALRRAVTDPTIRPPRARVFARSAISGCTTAIQSDGWSGQDWVPSGLMVRTDCDYIGKARQHGLDSGLERPHAVSAHVAERHRLERFIDALGCHPAIVCRPAGIGECSRRRPRSGPRFLGGQHQAGVSSAAEPIFRNCRFREFADWVRRLSARREI
jgi:hypothetical protein